jgi:O-antigen/teichoic acid export membrane protein
MSAEHLEYSGYLLVNSIGRQFLKRTDVLLLSLLVTLESTGGYNVAWKVAAVAKYGDQVLGNVLQPRLSKFIETDEIGTLLREFGQVRDLGVVASLPVLVLVVLFGEQILGIFGDYSAQYPVLVVLAVGAVVHSSFGSIGEIMIMGKRGRLVLLNTLVSVVGNVALGFVLIPRFGTMGAAVATVLSVYFLANLLGALEVKYFMRVDTFDYFSLGGTGVVVVVVIARVVGVLPSDLVLVVVVALVAAALLIRRATYLRELLSAATS